LLSLPRDLLQPWAPEGHPVKETEHLVVGAWCQRALLLLLLLLPPLLLSPLLPPLLLLAEAYMHLF